MFVQAPLLFPFSLLHVILIVRFVVVVCGSKKKTVVSQYYEVDVNKEHVILGNSAIFKCLIPSFVADFVDVVSWTSGDDEEETHVYSADAYG